MTDFKPFLLRILHQFQNLKKLLSNLHIGFIFCFIAIFVQPMQPPLEQLLKGRPTGPFYVTLVESTLFDGIFYLVLRGTMSGHQFGHKERQKSRMSVIIFKILIYVHVSIKESTIQHTRGMSINCPS